MSSRRLDSPLGACDTIITCRNCQGDEIRATPVRITRHTAVLEVYNPYSLMQLSEVLQTFRIMVGERCIYSGRAVVSNLLSTGIVLLCEVSLEDEWLDVDLFSPFSPQRRFVEEFEAFMVQWRKTQEIDAEFKVIVADFQMLLADLRRWLDQVELGVKSERDSDRHEEREQEILLELEERILPEVWQWMDRFDEVADDVQEDLRPACRAYARRQLHPLVLCAPFVHRTYQKPLGYAGDYEMVNMILRNPHEGATMFAKLVNVIFLQNPPAEAHRNRIQYLKRRLAVETRRVAAEGRKARILNLGCGPAREVELFLQEEGLGGTPEMRLLDFNSETIAYARRRLEAHMRGGEGESSLTFEERSIHQLLRDSVRRKPGPSDGIYDFVYCAGLFDYVSDRVCQQLTSLFYSMLAPGGVLLVTNVDASKPFRHSMEYLLDWHLIYRDQEDMRSLTPKTDGLPPASEVFADPTAVNLFLEVRKPLGR